eukprot:CAMPEP_0174272820 /NCGR_PEP_ID=MMETSP0439-20130205/52529_1 /TAXON_ID=0 /ORGANISM="Stereomyxa ramosa, Strain Chinc5" /LENGTH=442 /DNA_ID=CAMNT_0015363613 /DNA_START=151 /DNA_END=1479 /DNA_ORIENTATION=+
MIEEERETEGVSEQPCSKGAADGWPLHKAAWDNDLQTLTLLLNSEEYDIDERDCHGNPALHIAIHFRHRECVKELLSANADPTYKNGGMWTALQEAVACGDPNIVRDVMLAVRFKVMDEFESRLPTLISTLEKLPNFYMEMHWEFKSWVPLVSRFCPHDTYKIWKQGSCLRIDTTLIGLENMKWIRGDVSILFSTLNPEKASILFLDHDKKTIEDAMDGLTEYKREELVRDIREMMIHSLLRPIADHRDITFTEKKGWFSSEIFETVGEWEAKLYDVDGINYTTEHRSSKKKKKGQPYPKEEPFDMIDTKEEYFSTNLNDDKENYKIKEPNFKGRGLLYPSEHLTQKKRSFKGTLWLTKDFPRKISELVPIFEILSPRNKHFEKLMKFIEIIPDYGFPVKIEIPVFHLITGTASFISFQEQENDISLFEIPDDYAPKSTSSK